MNYELFIILEKKIKRTKESEENKNRKRLTSPRFGFIIYLAIQSI